MTFPIQSGETHGSLINYVRNNLHPHHEPSRVLLCFVRFSKNISIRSPLQLIIKHFSSQSRKHTVSSACPTFIRERLPPVHAPTDSSRAPDKGLHSGDEGEGKCNRPDGAWGIAGGREVGKCPIRLETSGLGSPSSALPARPELHPATEAR